MIDSGSEKCARAARKSPPYGGLFVFELLFSGTRGSQRAAASGQDASLTAGTFQLPSRIDGGCSFGQ